MNGLGIWAPAKVHKPTKAADELTGLCRRMATGVKFADAHLRLCVVMVVLFLRSLAFGCLVAGMKKWKGRGMKAMAACAAHPLQAGLLIEAWKRARDCIDLFRVLNTYCYWMQASKEEGARRKLAWKEGRKGGWKG